VEKIKEEIVDIANLELRDIEEISEKLDIALLKISNSNSTQKERDKFKELSKSYTNMTNNILDYTKIIDLIIRIEDRKVS
jgi:hypothetical protein